ncbi:hypothetical protein [Bacillus sp. ISL-7]|uniref:hypothetical protein n=1 Tax=Bacillus sp. ISL-7 TaxID=2819136 RepID=UPI001BE83829|nr:hypothetical protein [Bacillus sp. ISL-7]MBT2736164.1 hypothetical protein [Bacillus sp. ISL-7]
MTLIELKAILEASGYPVAYSHFNESITPPYICYLITYSSNLMADDKVYKKIDNVQIELYTSKKDLVAENNLETLLDENEIPYESIETFIQAEQIFQKIYEVRLL